MKTNEDKRRAKAYNHKYALRNIELLTIMIKASLSVIDDNDVYSKQFVDNQPYQQVLDKIYDNLT